MAADRRPTGYSVHYATLTTLLLRCCGIPARYVEGYVVTRQQAEALSDGAQLTLTQRAAHAWAEYYLDGVGWIPFDTVPGYEENISYQLPEDGDPARKRERHDLHGAGSNAPTEPDRHLSGTTGRPQPADLYPERAAGLGGAGAGVSGSHGAADGAAAAEAEAAAQAL